MRINKHSFFTFLIVAAVCVLPAVGSAQLTEYKLLEPLPGITTNGNGVSTNSGIYLTNLFQLALSLAVVLAVVRLIYAGVIYMSSDAFQKKSEAKGIIRDAFLGLGLAMSAWLIVFTILPHDPDGSFTFKLSLTSTPLPKNENPPPVPGAGGTTVPGGLTQTQAMQTLNAGQVKVAGAIQLTGVRQATLDEAVNIKARCGCTVTVTSATGGTHNEGTYSHANGYKIDLRSTGDGAALTSYITTNFTKMADRGDGAKQYRAPSGYIYALESSPAHWDVLVK